MRPPWRHRCVCRFNGAYRPDPVADWHLFARGRGQSPAIPAGRWEECLKHRDGVHPEVDGPRWQRSPDKTGGSSSRGCIGDGRPICSATRRPGTTPLVAAVTTGAVVAAGQVHAFIHGEGSGRRAACDYVRGGAGRGEMERRFPGYWCRGRTEETQPVSGRKAVALAENNRRRGPASVPGATARTAVIGGAEFVRLRRQRAHVAHVGRTAAGPAGQP